MPATVQRMPANFGKDQLKAFVERVERLEEEKKATSDDIRDVYAEAKGTGFDPKAIRQIVKLRKMDPDQRREQEEILETYMHALGMLPLFRAADEREFADTKVTISSGDHKVVTTAGAIGRAADELGARPSRRARTG
jgi:uncharacterized protein (UPF0335 family)